jgi:hypothetical protein
VRRQADRQTARAGAAGGGGGLFQALDLQFEGFRVWVLEFGAAATADEHAGALVQGALSVRCKCEALEPGRWTWELHFLESKGRR